MWQVEKSWLVVTRRTKYLNNMTFIRLSEMGIQEMELSDQLAFFGFMGL
jgi:hypothetical protein